jgi:pimeloyl-ACP methyl ester carboxylesterase
MAEKSGFYRDLGRHFAVYVPRGSTCVVTFDNLKSRDQPAPRFPWGHDFCERKNYSQLGIMMTRRNDWFRQRPLCDFFDELSQNGFFDQFDDVVFYGSSMGGYGALTYAASCPSARAVAFSPQTSLSPAAVPWENRYRRGYDRGDWSIERYADAAETINQYKEASIFYDPYFKIDRLHANRLQQPNVNHFRCPFMGHKVPRMLLHMGVLDEVVTGAIEGTLEATQFYTLLRLRRDYIGYFRSLSLLAIEENKSLGQLAIRWAKSNRPEWHIPRLKKMATDP